MTLRFLAALTLENSNRMVGWLLGFGDLRALLDGVMA